MKYTVDMLLQQLFAAAEDMDMALNGRKIPGAVGIIGSSGTVISEAEVVKAHMNLTKVLSRVSQHYEDEGATA